MAEPILKVEELRKKLMERVASIRGKVLGQVGERTILRGEGSSNRILGQALGQGAIIEQATKRVDELLATVKEKRPNIIPTVLEKVKAFEPGKRITEIVAPPTGEGAPTPTEKKKFLRG